MSNYAETTVTGQVWQRCSQIVIDNPRHAVPTVRFEEERVVSLDTGDELRKPAPGITQDFDPALTVPLRNPVTGELTGDSISYAEVYAILYSAYIAAATARDERLAPPPQPEATQQAPSEA
jgi:hypothetical protein